MAEENVPDGSGEEKAPPAVDGKFEITVSADKFTAELKVTPPNASGKPIAAGDVEEKITEIGLKNVRGNSMRTYLSDGNFVQPLVIAEGKAPVPGQDGSVEYPYQEKRGSREDKHGNVDLRNVSAFKFAAKGDMLVKNHPPMPGQDGVTVFGDAIPFPPGRDLAPAPGKNVEVSADGTEYVATEAGLVLIAGNQISVDKVLKTEGDLDFKVGNIDFDGSVIITGAIMEGFKVKATGDVFAQLVSQSSVDAGGNVTIEKGIIGVEGTSVTAKGNVTAKFIENAHIKAGGSVVVGEAVMHSTISAGKHVVVRGGKHCNIVGGTVQVAGSVEAHTIGSESGTKTVIEIGLDPASRERLQHLDAELVKQSENFEKVKQAVATLTKIKAQTGQLPPAKDDLLKKLTETSGILEKELADFQKEHADLQTKLQHARPGTINAKEAILPGTTVTILSETVKINKKYASTSVYLDREHKKIAFGSFSEVDVG